MFNSDDQKKKKTETKRNTNIIPTKNALHDAIETSKRRLECLDEFTSNEKIISSSFFHIFLLGKAYMTSGTISTKHQRHMLLQYTGTAGRCHETLFTLFDQKQRHSNSRGINTVVRNNKDYFAQFSKLVNNKNFRNSYKKQNRIQKEK